MIIFPGGVRQKRNFRRGGGVRFESQFLENPEGRGGHRKNPFRGGVWIFSGTTQYLRTYSNIERVFPCLFSGLVDLLLLKMNVNQST